MEYVLGTEGAKETLRTKGSSHSCLEGYHETEREYPDQTITDRFFVVEHLLSAEDDEGNCYDWYEIDQHYRYTDKADAIKSELQPQIDYIAMMTDVDMEPEE